MARRWLARASAFSASMALAACGLSSVGVALLEEEAGAPAQPDAAEVDRVTPDAAEPDAAAPDATPPCEVKIEDPFSTAVDETRWLRVSSNNDDFPKLADAGGPVLSLMASARPQARGAVWLKSEVPLDAFDVGVDFAIACTNNDCADGLTFAWVGTTDATKLTDAPSGSGLGIPRGLPGVAVAVDLFQSVGISDPQTPNVSILEIDGGAEPGTYPWTLAASKQRDNLVGAMHRLDISLRGKELVVRVDGAGVVKGTLAYAPAKGSFGIGAATGQDYAAFVVRNFSGRFYRCAAPPLPDAGL